MRNVRPSNVSLAEVNLAEVCNKKLVIEQSLSILECNLKWVVVKWRKTDPETNMRVPEINTITQSPKFCASLRLRGRDQTRRGDDTSLQVKLPSKPTSLRFVGSHKWLGEVIRAPIRALNIVTLLRTPLITTHEPPRNNKEWALREHKSLLLQRLYRTLLSH